MTTSDDRSRVDAPPATSRGHAWLLGSAALLGCISALYPPLSVFAVLALVIALASAVRFVHPRKASFLLALGSGALLSGVGLYRFVTGDALSGIIEARGRATSARAVSLLREILFAEDAARRYAMIDHDGDGIGSAGLLGELTGAQPARGHITLATPPLAPRLTPHVITPSGPALSADGYLYLVCLPGAGGTWVTRPDGAIDEELAERRWVAYAWPESSDGPHVETYFIDEHERILTFDNIGPGGTRVLGGPERAPACDFALANDRFVPWKGKKPRSSLPGDRRARP